MQGATVGTREAQGWAAPMDKQGERERHAAAAWIGAHLGGNSGAELTKAVEQLLEQRFDGHWYPSEPDRGSAYRVMKTSVDELDPLLARAAVSAGVSPSRTTPYLCARIRRIRLSGGGEFDGRGKGKAKSVSAILNSRSLCSSGGIGTPTTLLWEGARARPGGCADRSQLPVSMCHSQATHQLREAHTAQHSSQQRMMAHPALRATVLAVILCEAYVASSEQRGSPCEQPRRMYAE